MLFALFVDFNIIKLIFCVRIVSLLGKGADVLNDRNSLGADLFRV